VVLGLCGGDTAAVVAALPDLRAVLDRDRELSLCVGLWWRDGLGWRVRPTHRDDDPVDDDVADEDEGRTAGCVGAWLTPIVHTSASYDRALLLTRDLDLMLAGTGQALASFPARRRKDSESPWGSTSLPTTSSSKDSNAICPRPVVITRQLSLDSLNQPPAHDICPPPLGCVCL